MNISQDYTDAFDIEGMYTWVDVVRFDQSYNSTSSNAPDDILPVVLRCKFTWCAQYHGSTKFINGTLSDVLDFSVPLVIDSSTGPYVPDGANIPVAQLQQFTQSDEQYQISNDLSTVFHNSLASILQNNLFAQDPDLVYLSDVLEQLPSSYQAEYESALLNQLNMGRIYSLYYANEGNLSKTLDNIAVSVTNQMRSGSDSTNVTGTATYPNVYIEVIWPWFIYSAALTVSAAALLALTIWLCSGHDKVVWKSSSLALLFHGLPDGRSDGRILDAAAMETAAKEIWAKLSADEAGGVKLKTL